MEIISWKVIGWNIKNKRVDLTGIIAEDTAQMIDDDITANSMHSLCRRLREHE